MYICTPRITGECQITDLFPHKTQSNATVDPRFQGPVYLYSPSVSHPLPVLDADFDLVSEVSGLAAYFLACLENQVNGEACTPAQAKAIADAVVARMESGLSLTKEDIDTLIVAELGAGGALDGGASEGDVEEVIAILSGYKVFTLPSGQSIAGALNAFEGLGLDVPADYLSDPSYADRLITELSVTMKASARNGQISRATKRTDSEGNSAPLLVIYNSDGTLFR